MRETRFFRKETTVNKAILFKSFFSSEELRKIVLEFAFAHSS